MLDKMSEEKPAAICQGTIGSFRTIPSRSVCSFTVETDISQLELVARIAKHGEWVAVCRIQPPTETNPTKKKNWHEIPPSSQAAILCTDPEFQLYLNVDSEEKAAQHVRVACGVGSRSDLSTNEAAAALFEQIVEQYRIWQRARA